MDVLLDSSRGRCNLNIVPFAASSVIGRRRGSCGGIFHFQVGPAVACTVMSQVRCATVLCAFGRL